MSTTFTISDIQVGARVLVSLPFYGGNFAGTITEIDPAFPPSLFSDHDFAVAWDSTAVETNPGWVNYSQVVQIYGTGSAEHVALSGLYGLQLQAVIDMLKASSAFSAFAAAGDVFVMTRTDNAQIESGDTWAEVDYGKDDYTLLRQFAGPGIANFDRDVEVSVWLVKAVASATEAERRRIINVAGAVATDIIDSANGLVISSLVLGGIAVKDKTTPHQIAAQLKIKIGI